MNKKIKYALCFVLSAAITALVVFLPYFYYSVNDRSHSEAVTETLLLERSKDSLTVREYTELVTSEPIWVNNGIIPDEQELMEIIKGAITYLSISFYDNDYAACIFESFNESLQNQKSFYSKIESTTVNGNISGKPASSSLLYIEYYPEDNNNNEYSMLLDRKTQMIYEFYYCANEDKPIFYGHESESTEFDSSFDYNKISDLTYNNLLSYWETADKNQVTVITEYNEFGFNILPVSYIDYRFKNYNCFEVIEEKE